MGAYSDLHTIGVYRGHKFIMGIQYTVNKHTLIHYGKKGAITRQLPGQKLRINSLVQRFLLSNKSYDIAHDGIKR